jgi:predicted alpha/beta superfamily hydrolase
MPRVPASIPQLRLHRRFASRGLRNRRDLVVWLPPGYTAASAARRRYPVIYFQDGQNIFDPATAFLGQAWHAGETCAELVRRRQMPAPILVGVANTGESRIDEYTPTPGDYAAGPDGSRRSRGDGRRYARFLVNEVKPFIDARYRTLPGPRTTGVIGSSMGGLIALYLALWHPRIFGHVAAMSPSVWWDNRVALRDFAALTRKPDVRLWIDIGTAEPGWETVPLFRDTLVNRGWKMGADLRYAEIAGGQHNEVAWGARVGEVLRWMLGAGGGRGKARITRAP